MLDPLRLASTAIEFGVARYRHSESRMCATLALGACGVLCACSGGGFATAALLIYLIPILGAAAATLVVAGALVLLASVAFGLAHYLARRSAARDHAAPPDLQAMASDAENFVREHKAPALAAAFVAGLLAGDEGPRLKDR